MVPACVVGDDIEENLETEFMRFFYKGDEVIHRAVFRIDAGVVGAGVIAAEGTEAFFLTDGGDRHQPEDVDAHIAEAGEFAEEGVDGSFAGVLPEVYFIDV